MKIVFVSFWIGPEFISEWHCSVASVMKSFNLSRAAREIEEYCERFLPALPQKLRVLRDPWTLRLRWEPRLPLSDAREDPPRLSDRPRPRPLIDWRPEVDGISEFWFCWINSAKLANLFSSCWNLLCIISCNSSLSRERFSVWGCGLPISTSHFRAKWNGFLEALKKVYKREKNH